MALAEVLIADDDSNRWSAKEAEVGISQIEEHLKEVALDEIDFGGLVLRGVTPYARGERRPSYLAPTAQFGGRVALGRTTAMFRPMGQIMPSAS